MRACVCACVCACVRAGPNEMSSSRSASSSRSSRSMHFVAVLPLRSYSRKIPVRLRRASRAHGRGCEQMQSCASCASPVWVPPNESYEGHRIAHPQPPCGPSCGPTHTVLHLTWPNPSAFSRAQWHASAGYSFL